MSLGAIFEKSVCVKECPRSTTDEVFYHATANVAEGDLDMSAETDWHVNSYSIMKICLPLDPPASVEAGL